MLHFPPDNPGVVYIGMCDLCEVRQSQKMIASLYGFSKELQDVINARKMH
jgi:hypothetical protein